MDEEQAVLEQLTLSDFKKWSSSVLKTFSFQLLHHNNAQQL